MLNPELPMLAIFGDLLLFLSHVQFSVTHCNARQAPLSMAFARQEPWSGLPFPSPGDLCGPGTEPSSPALAGRFFTPKPPGKPKFGENGG